MGTRGKPQVRILSISRTFAIDSPFQIVRGRGREVQSYVSGPEAITKMLNNSTSLSQTPQDLHKEVTKFTSNFLDLKNEVILFGFLSQIWLFQ